MAKKMINNESLGGLMKKDPTVHSLPKSAQEIIDIVKVSESGIFELPGNRFSATWEIDDINYKIEDEYSKDDILYKYATEVVNPIQNPFKITIINKKKDIQGLEDEYLIPYKSDEYVSLRESVNQEVLQRIKQSRKGFNQKKYITISSEVQKMESLNLKFKIIEQDLEKGFAAINSGIKRLTGDERLNVIRDIIQSDSEIPMPSLASMAKKNRSYLDELVSMQGFDFSDNGKYEGFRSGKKYASAIYVASYPDILSDEFMDNLMDYPVESIISLDFVPVSPKAANDFINSVYQAVENKISKQQRIRNRNKEYSSDISETVKKEKSDVKKVIEQSRESCEKMYLGAVTMILFADTKSELISAIANIKSLAEKKTVRMEVAWLQQKESFMTALPIGNRYTEYLRTMFSSDVATLCPFQTAKIKVKGERMCYGLEMVSDNPIFGNRRSLTFGGGFNFGKPGTGKSQAAKWEMAYTLVSSDDSIICIDPTLEYKELIPSFHGEFLNFAPGSENHINPLHCELSIFTSGKLDEFIDDTADYMLAVFNSIMPGEIESAHNTIISRCVRILFEQIADLAEKERYIPIMSDLKEVIDKQPEPQAKDLSLALELFTSGAFRMFNAQNNISLDTRFTCFGIRDVGKRLFGLAELTINRFIDNQVKENWKKNITTWIYYDEIHEILKEEESAKYLDKSWRKHRKQKAIDTGMTHTIEELIENDTAKAMVKNSEFILMLKSSKISCAALLSSVEGMKENYLKYIINSRPGCGLLKHGKEIIPIDGTMEENNPLTILFNTDPHKNEK
ncbi:MAG: hypothetical protein IJA36_06080 [Lachnospiraceae bacterium]|nr:hypothetical protein [Lachnospiraceae bacterium]